ncbi:hypothetical protein LCGC14_1851520 [marine sediment metagenome]|uniref:Uncharacterized protein n=1 Tax=marine sediment metagenome TaxID=412755 RepID=A0A0F9GYJ1_9ZZZZ
MKYVHIDSNGSMKIRDHQLPDWKYGWVYKVPDDFQFELGSANAENRLYFCELLENDPRAELIFDGEVERTTTNYSDIKGPNTLAEFLMKDLSTETLFKIYQDKNKNDLGELDAMTNDPAELLREHISYLFYTASYNLVMNIHYKLGLLDEETVEQIINE